MATTIEDGYLYITDGTLTYPEEHDDYYEEISDTGKTTLKTKLISYDEDMNKSLTPIVRPVPRGQWPTQPYKIWILDMKNIKQTFKFTVKIMTDGDGTVTAKLADLRKLVGLGTADGDRQAGTVSFVWGLEANQYSFDGNFQKILVKRKSDLPRTSESTAGSRDFPATITIQVLRGEDR